MQAYSFGLMYYSEVSAKFMFVSMEFGEDWIVMLTVDHPFDRPDLQTWFWFSEMWADHAGLKEGVANADEASKVEAEQAGIPRKLEYSTVVEDEREGILSLLDRATVKLWPGAKWHFEERDDHGTEQAMYEHFRQDVLYALLLHGHIPADTGSIPEAFWIPEWQSEYWSDRNT